MENSTNVCWVVAAQVVAAFCYRQINFSNVIAAHKYFVCPKWRESCCSSTIDDNKTNDIMMWYVCAHKLAPKTANRQTRPSCFDPYRTRPNCSRCNRRSDVSADVNKRLALFIENNHHTHLPWRRHMNTQLNWIILGFEFFRLFFALVLISILFCLSVVFFSYTSAVRALSIYCSIFFLFLLGFEFWKGLQRAAEQLLYNANDCTMQIYVVYATTFKFNLQWHKWTIATIAHEWITRNIAHHFRNGFFSLVFISQMPKLYYRCRDSKQRLYFVCAAFLHIFGANFDPTIYLHWMMCSRWLNLCMPDITMWDTSMQREHFYIYIFIRK